MKPAEMTAPPAEGAPSATRTRAANGLRHLRSCELVGRDVRVTGPVLVRGQGSVVVGDGVVLDAAQAPIELVAATGARLELGPGAYVGPGASVEAGACVTVGAGARLGPFAKIMDNNWHGTKDDRGGRPESNPVVVGAGARIGARATMLPGAALGAGSVLSDDSVLSGRVPAGVVVSGIPARLVRRLAADDSPESVTGAEGPEGSSLTCFRHLAEVPDPVSPSMLRSLELLEGLHRLARSQRGKRLLARAEVALALLNGRRRLRAARSSHVVVHGALDVRNAGSLDVGHGCGFASGPLTSRLEVLPGATLSIGPGAVVNYGVVVRAQESIRIGRDLLMGSRCLILDSFEGVSAPVVIGDGVWLAHGVTVLPGVTIGDGSAVSAGSVVDRDVPAGCLAVGSPLKLRALPAVIS